MNSIKRSFRQFNVRAQMGRIGQSTTHISSGTVRDCEEGNQRISDDEIITDALRILSKRLLRAHALNDRRSMGEYLVMRFAGLEHEVFACLYLDARNRVIACEELFRGTIDRADVYSREVVKKALEHNAAGIILAHNHPSGVAEPSHADELRTRQLKEALALVDIRVVDHFVIGGADFVSFSERGLL